jgi:hypothetical protein
LKGRGLGDDSASISMAQEDRRGLIVVERGSATRSSGGGAGFDQRRKIRPMGLGPSWTGRPLGLGPALERRGVGRKKEWAKIRVG